MKSIRIDGSFICAISTQIDLMLTLIGVTHSKAIELFLSKDAAEFGRWEGSTTFQED